MKNLLKRKSEFQLNVSGTYKNRKFVIMKMLIGVCWERWTLALKPHWDKVYLPCVRKHKPK